MAVSDCVDSFGLLVFEMGVGMPFRPPVFKGPSWVVIPLSPEADHRLDSRRDGVPDSTYLRDVAQKEGACQLESISLWCLHMQDRGQPGEKGAYRYDVSDTPYRYW